MKQIKRLLALTMVLSLLLGASGIISAAENDPIAPSHTPYTLRFEHNPDTGAIVAPTINLRDYNIIYGGFHLESVDLLVYLLLAAIFSGLAMDYLDGNDIDPSMLNITLPEGGAAMFGSITPAWRNLNPPSGINLARRTWDIPGFGGFTWSSSDESVFRFECAQLEDDVSLDDVVWIIAEQPGTAYLRLTFNDHPITIQKPVTVTPRAGAFPMPRGFMMNPHVVRVHTGNTVVSTLSAQPDFLPLVNFNLLDGNNDHFYFNTNPQVARIVLTDAELEFQETIYSYNAFVEELIASLTEMVENGYLTEEEAHEKFEQLRAEKQDYLSRTFSELQIEALSPGTTVLTFPVMAINPLTGVFVNAFYYLEVIVSDELDDLGLATNLIVSPDSAALYVGGTIALQAQVLPGDAENSLIWISNNPTVARVSNAGVVTALRAGTAEITARTLDGSNLSATSVITVNNRLVQQITLSQTEITLAVGEETPLTAIASPTYATIRDLAVSVSNPDIISFENGVVRALSPGTATITFSAQDGSGVSASLVVTTYIQLVESIVPSQTEMTISVGDLIPLTAAALPANATNPELSVMVSDPNIIRHENGVVRALTAGTATVTFFAQDGGEVTSTVTVESVLTPIYVDPAVAAGGFHYHVAMLRYDATVWTWNYGEIEPTQVPGLFNITQVAIGAHNLALRNDGTVWVWGENRLPEQVQGLSRIVDISTGLEHSLAVCEDGTVWAWGGNRYLQVGVESVAYVAAPMQVAFPTGVFITAVAAGGNHSIVLCREGYVHTWGRVAQGHSTAEPHREILTHITGVTAGLFHGAARVDMRAVWSWAIPNYDSVAITRRIPMLYFDAGGLVTAIVSDNAEILLWHQDLREAEHICSELCYMCYILQKDSLQSIFPHKVYGLQDIVSVSTGMLHVTAVCNDGYVWVIGDVFECQKTPATQSIATPLRIPNFNLGGNPPSITTVFDTDTGVSAEFASDTFPAGTLMQVEFVTTDAMNSTNAALQAWDISFVYSDMKVQPNGYVTIRLPIPLDAGYAPEQMIAHHIDTDGNATPLETRVERNYLVFETDRFSTFAIFIQEISHQCWYQQLPAWIQWILRWIFFGWIWMSC